MLKITRVTQTTAIGADSRPLVVLRIEFTVGDNGPFTLDVSKADFDAGQAMAQVQAFAAQLQRLTGI